MLKRDDWLPLSRDLDWEWSYAKEVEAFPPVVAGSPWLPASDWAGWDEPFRVAYGDYVSAQTEKDESVVAVREAVGRLDDYRKLSAAWLNGLKLHVATLPLAEFGAVVGCLRGARFGRVGAWRAACTFAALDEIRHTQIPLLVMHELVKWDPQFDWTLKFYHTDNWVAIAARHMIDELLIGSNPIEFAIATNFVFESGFTNLQFVGLSSLAHDAGDAMFEKMVNSIQSDETRHSLIGRPVLQKLIEHDRATAQYLLDKWFWRSWQIFAVVTGFAMDYLTPVEQRTSSFKEFVEEWVIDQYLRTLEEYGLSRPWYWDTFLQSLDNYHHMVYASAYTYRSTVWFDFTLPGPLERAWLAQKYPQSWPKFEPVWSTITSRWAQTDPGNEFAVHGTSLVGFCDMCQLVLSGGTPDHNTVTDAEYSGQRYIFCSEPCKWIFEKEPQRYAKHHNVVRRVLDGDAPGNLLALVRQTFGLEYATWGKDVAAGDYAWLKPLRSAARPGRGGGAL